MIKVVDYWAEWCGPCKMMNPIMEELIEQFPEVAFEKVNVDRHEGRAKANKVVSIPTIIVYKDNVEVSRVVGYQNKVGLIKLINSAK